jgi:hypothetical protein
VSTDPVTPAPEPEPGPPTPAAAAPPLPPVEPHKPITDTRPEILVGAAAAGGFIVAQILGRLRGR